MALRDGPFSEIKVPLTLAAGVAVAIVAAGTVFLLVSDRRETLEEAAYTKAQATADQAQAAVGEVLSWPVRMTRAGIDGVRSFFGAVAENPRLRRENKRIPVLEAEIRHQKDENERLRVILGLKTDPPMPMVTGRAVTDARGPFAHARLVNVGSDKGVKVGNPVMSEYGLVGRVVGVQPNLSRVLLLTDVASRTPVMIDRNNARAILTGDGGAFPKLANMRSRDPPRVGDLLVTSGDGGVLPRGLPVGVVVRGLDRSWRAQLASDRAPIDYVRIIQFEDFTQLANEQALSASLTPAQMGGAIPPPQPPAPTLKIAPKVDPNAAKTAAAPAPATKAPAPKTATPPAPAVKAPAPAASAPKTATPAAAVTTAPAPATKAPAPPPANNAPKATPTPAPAVKTGE